MQPRSRSVEAIVVAYESAAVLPACLQGLAANGVLALVVDNASRDGSAEIAERLAARVVRSSRNEGYGRANNRGARESTADYVLILNPDIVLEPGAIGELLAAAERYPDAGLLAPSIVEPDGRRFFQARSLLAGFLPNPRGIRMPPDGDCCAPFLSGACFLVDRRLFLDLGGFDASLFLFYEDDDLCRRFSDNGRPPIHVHGAIARHLRGGSSAPLPGRIYNARWHLAWSRAYVARKYGLPSSSWSLLGLNALRTWLALVTFRRALVERYAGSAAGALAALRGRTALARQGLDPP